MLRAVETRASQVWMLNAAFMAAMLLAVSSGSCAFDIQPNLCEQFDIRCQDGQECAAHQAICIEIDGCGNGIVDVDEVCDDGNVIDGAMDATGAFVVDSCNHDCTSTQVCGNGIVDAGEACDDGVRNGSPVATCDVECQFVERTCGNDIVNQDLGEQCDPGPADSASCNSYMAGPAACRVSQCGDSYTNAAAGEVCDSGGTDSAQCIGATCRLSVCGDNYINSAAGEVCESQNDSAGCNGKNATASNGTPVGCHLPRCGDGYTNLQFSPPGGNVEQCDNLGGGDTSSCNGNNSGMNGIGSCRVPSCGDGYVNPQFLPPGNTTGEQCDTLGGSDSSTCNGNGAVSLKCHSVVCGDGYKNTTAGETCEPPGGADTSTCNGSGAGAVSCHAAACGDNYKNMMAGETCDNGVSDTDTCNGVAAGTLKCKVATCGDGYRNSAHQEVCDNGPTDTSLCNGNNAGTASCKAPMCGDGHVNTAAGEKCEVNADCTDPMKPNCNTMCLCVP